MRDAHGKLLKDGDLVTLHGPSKGLMYFTIRVERGAAGKVIGWVRAPLEGLMVIVQFPGENKTFRIKPELTRRCNFDHEPARKSFKDLLKDIFSL